MFKKKYLANKTNNTPFVLIILLLSFLTIFLRLGMEPPGVLVDEASLGYNSYSLLKTGRDEWQQQIPFTLTSFGDYKPAGYAYLALPFINIFGLNTFSVRLPSAFAGLLSILFIYLIIKRITSNNNLAIICSFLLAISPWQIYMSRMAWEANMALMFFLAGLCFLISKPNKTLFILISAVLFSLSQYIYVGYKILTPLLLAVFLIYLVRTKLILKKNLLVFILIFITFSLPQIYSLLYKGGANRFNQVSIFNRAGTVMFIDEQRSFCGMSGNKLTLSMCYLFWNKPAVIISGLIKQYLASYSGDFLFFTGDDGAFINNPNHGGTYFWLYPFFIIGLFVLISGINRKEYRFILLWFLSAPIMSVLAAKPNYVRSNMILIPVIIICAIGLDYLINKLPVKGLFSKSVGFLLLFCVGFISVSITMVDYFFVYTKKAMAWDEYFPQISQYLEQNDFNYQEVYIKKFNSNPYIYLLFYQAVDPNYFWDQVTKDGFNVLSIGKYKFTDDNFNYIYCNWKKTGQKKTLFISNEVQASFNPVYLIKSYNQVHSLIAIYDLEKTEQFLKLKENINIICQ